MSVEDQIREAIAGALDADVEDLSDDAFLADQFGADPYDLEDMSAALSEEFNIEFDEEEVDLWNTIGDIIQAVLEKIEE